MCFSAPASFTASSVIATIGGLGFLKKPAKSLRWFAFIPILFAVQQTIEGIQWLVAKPSTASLLLGYGFLLFAFLLWPVYLPLAFTAAEPSAQRKAWLNYFVLLGGLVTLYLLGVVWRYPLTVTVVNQHIHYAITIPYEFWVGYSYILVTCGSALLSTRPWIQRFGVLAFIGVLLSLWYSYTTFTSVWCFIAALLSAIIYLELRSRSQR